MKKLFLLLVFFGLGFFGFGQELPNNWTGDTGIDTYKESTTVNGGSYSCKVDVNTGTQADCDMRHDQVSVTAGDTYTYSFYVKTSSHVRVRFIFEWVGSNDNMYGQYGESTSGFTEVTGSGTVPSGATAVKIGVRFYDKSGFSAPETQYIDDFTFESPTGSAIALTNGDMEHWSSNGPDDPDILTVTTQSTTEIQAEWLKNGAGDNVMVAWNSSDTFGTPTNGTSYSSGNSITGGGTVLYNGSDTEYDHTSLTSGVTYYYKAWSVDGSIDYSTGITDNATTFAPTIALSPSTLSGFSYTVEEGPSAEQTFTVEGSHLSANITLTAPTNYEISETSGGGYTSPITLTQSGGSVATTTIYTRLKTDLSVGDYNNENITASSTDATDQTVSCSGTVDPIDDPTAFTATTISSTQIDLAWTQNGNSNNVLVAWNSSNTFGDPTGSYVVGDPITGGGTVIVNGSSTAYNHTSLTAGTRYYYKAWSVDGSTPLNYSNGITDDASTLSDPVTSFPWTEDFEHSGDAPIGWTQEYVSATVDWIYMAGGLDAHPAAAHGGSYNATFYSENYANDQSKLVTIPLDLSGLTTPILSFWHTQAEYGGDQDILKVYYKTSSGGVWNLISDQTYASSITIWTEESEIALPNPSAEYYIAFDALSGYGYGVCIDDVTVQESPISNPTSFAIDNVTSTKMELTWTAPAGTYDNVLVFGRSGAVVDHSPSGAGSAYNDANVAWGSAGSYDNSKLLYSGTGTSLTVTGLSEETEYYFKAYAYDDSNWSDGTSDINDEAEVQGTSGFAATAGNTQASLSWTNYTGAQSTWWNEVLILAHSGATVDATPSGDGSSYTANTAFGSGTEVGTGNFVVYKGTGTSETVSALTNGTIYHFRIFGRYGSDWTDADEYESASCEPSSLFEPTSGDLVINEVNDHNTTGAEFTEIYNTTANEINLEKVDLEYYNINPGPVSAIKHLTGTIGPNSYIVLARGQNDFNTVFGFYPDFEFTDMYNNGGKDGMLIRHDDNGIIDQFNDVPNATGEWGSNLMCRFYYTNDGSDLDTDWDNSGYNYTGTPRAKNELTWQTTGTVNWETSTNWHNGDLPSKAVSVIIPSGGTQPSVDGTEADPMHCFNLTINSGAVLTVLSEGFLTVNNTLTNNAGTTGIVLQSNSTSPSSLIHNTNNVSATVESYFTVLDAWYLISPPISDATAAVFNLQYLDYWDEPNGVWVDITDENTALNSGQGYSLKKTNANGDGNIATYSGSLNNGNITTPNLRRTSGTYAGWNLVGNPYPSVLSVDEMSFSNIDAAVSVWPHTGTESSSYISYSKGTGGASEARYIQPGQGFMVQVSSGQDNQSLTFTNAMRTHTGLGVIDKSNNEETNIHELLKITVSGNETTIDETYIGFRDGSTIYFDSYYDVHKLFGAATNPHIFSYINLEEDEKVAIQSFPQPAEGDVVHLGTRIGLTGNYELSFTGMYTFAPDQAFILLDKKNNELYEIRYDSVIGFTHENGDSENRFDLIFDMTTNIDEPNITIEGFNVFISNNKLYLSNIIGFEENTQLEIYDILGQKLIEQKITNITGGISIDLSSAYYIIKLQSTKGIKSKKFFVP